MHAVVAGVKNEPCAFSVREHPVEQNHGVRTAGDGRLGHAQRLGDIDDMAFFLQQAPYRLGEAGIVFNEQDFHGFKGSSRRNLQAVPLPPRYGGYLTES